MGLIIICLLYTSQYNATYFATYKESGIRRITLAEHLRKIPLSFFGKKDLADLTLSLIHIYLSEKDSEFLKNNNYTKEEVLSGFKQLLMQSRYTDLLCLVKDEE